MASKRTEPRSSFLGQVQSKVGQRLEAAEPCKARAVLQASPRALFGLDRHELLEPAVCLEIVQSCKAAEETQPLERILELRACHHCRLRSRRRSGWLSFGGPILVLSKIQPTAS